MNRPHGHIPCEVSLQTEIETMANVSVLAHEEPVSGECLVPLQKGLWSVGCTRKGHTAAAAVSVIRGGIVGAGRIKKNVEDRPSKALMSHSLLRRRR